MRSALAGLVDKLRTVSWSEFGAPLEGPIVVESANSGRRGGLRILGCRPRSHSRLKIRCPLAVIDPLRQKQKSRRGWRPQRVSNHVGLLVNGPPGAAGLPFS
jgi:hypothetical protein